MGNLKTLTDPVNNKTTFSYDGGNRLTEEKDPLGNAITYAYDLANRLTSRTDRLARRRDFSYDDADRLTAEAWISGGSTVQNLTFTYDANSNILTARDNDGTHTFTYDGLNRPTAVTSMFGLTLTNTFDAVGNRTKREDNFGGILTSTYDAADRLTKREFGGSGQTPLRIDLTYTNRDQVETITRYSDLAGTTKVGSSTYTYNPVGQVSNLSHRNGSSTLLANYTYTYDLASRLTSEVLNGTTTNFGYDATDQLTSDGTTNYTFDLNGNRTMTGYQTGTGNRLTNDGTWTYTYDAEGNLTKKSKGPTLETWDYAYDNINHLTSVTKRASDGGTVQMQATYTYDVFGNRIQTEVDSDGAGAGASVIARFGFDNPSNMLSDVWVDLNSSNALQMRRLYLDAVDSVYARINSSGTAAWYLPDRLGSIRDLVDAAGAVQDHIDYSAFGVITSESNPSFGDRYKWTGREFDSESGLQYNRARYYDAAVGRWLNEDPIGFGGGDGNLFRYVSNSPTLWRDPTGWFGDSGEDDAPHAGPGPNGYFDEPGNKGPQNDKPRQKEPARREEKPVLFRDRMQKQLPTQRKRWKEDPKSYEGKLILVRKKADIDATLKSIGINKDGNKGEMFKYLVTTSGKLIFFRVEIEHPYGTAVEEGHDVGEDVQAAGRARYYPGIGLIYDIDTGHYQIDKESKPRQEAAKRQAKKVFDDIPVLRPRWEKSVRPYQEGPNAIPSKRQPTRVA